jgi:hypothetical protein
VIDMLFGDFFFIWVIETNTEDVGHGGTQRPRLYFLFLNKTRGVCLEDPVTLFRAVSMHLKEHLSTEPADYLVATEREIQLEAMRLAALRSIPYTDAFFLI